MQKDFIRKYYIRLFELVQIFLISLTGFNINYLKEYAFNNNILVCKSQAMAETHSLTHQLPSSS
jgi:hypothetical protein